jgi:hypothetical protein
MSEPAFRRSSISCCSIPMRPADQQGALAPRGGLSLPLPDFLSGDRRRDCYSWGAPQQPPSIIHAGVKPKARGDQAPRQRRGNAAHQAPRGGLLITQFPLIYKTNVLICDNLKSNVVVVRPVCRRKKIIVLGFLFCIAFEYYPRTQ